MRLKLLDIDRFISSHNVLEVTSSKTPSKVKQYTEPTLWGADIFGNPGSRARGTQFGFISLNTKIFNPAVYRIVKGLNASISAIMDSRKSYIFENGLFIESKENGRTGISFLLEVFPDLDLVRIAKKDKKKDAKWLDKNRSIAVIDKFLVIPAQSRDLEVNSSTASIADINAIYLDVLRHAQAMLAVEGADDQIVSETIKRIQWSVYKVYNWLSSKLTGKKGLFRQNMLRKSTDFSSRLILASSPAIKFGNIGVPWHTLIQLYEPLFFHKLKNEYTFFETDILEYMKITDFDRVTNNLMVSFANKVNTSPSSTPPAMVMTIKEILQGIVPTQTIIYKRDPVLSRNSWASATPVVIDGAIAQLNSLDLGPIGGDSDGDQVLIAPLFTKEAKKAAEKMNPSKSDSKWRDVSNSNDIIYSLSLDTVSAVYRATRE